MTTADFWNGLKSHLDAIITSAITSLVVISSLAIGVIYLSDRIDDSKNAISDLKTDVAMIKARINDCIESHNIALYSSQPFNKHKNNHRDRSENLLANNLFVLWR